MARTLLVGAAVLVFSIVNYRAAEAGSPELSVAVTGECLVSDAVLAIATREATRVWSGGALDVRWVPVPDLPYESPRTGWLVVRCVAEADMPRNPNPRVLPIAAIRFVGTSPTNTILVSVTNALTLMKREFRESRDLNERFNVLRELRLGRMLGRAIAHEIGHFVTRSGAHASTGLMKASHPVAALMGESLKPFRVDPISLSTRQVASRSPALTDLTK